MRRIALLLTIPSAIGTSIAAPASATTFEQSRIEGGLQLGVIDRSLGSAVFRRTMNAQLYGDVMVLPSLLAVGVYAHGTPAGDRATPSRLAAPEVTLTAIGLRVKGYLPVSGRIHPYATIGIGRMTAEFPTTRGTLCTTTCVDHVAPESTKRFIDLPIGLGARLDLEGPFVMTLEGGYRQAIGYSNPEYERTLTSAPRSGGSAWTFHVSFGLAF